MSKMIDIKGVQVSEDTIVEALKKHIDFKEPVKDFKVSGFYVKKCGSHCVLALDQPYVDLSTAPSNYMCRRAFNKWDITRIIEGLQELIKD